jgi:hypothetical protein
MRRQMAANYSTRTDFLSKFFQLPLYDCAITNILQVLFNSDAIFQLAEHVYTADIMTTGADTLHVPATYSA